MRTSGNVLYLSIRKFCSATGEKICSVNLHHEITFSDASQVRTAPERLDRQVRTASERLDRQVRIAPERLDRQVRITPEWLDCKVKTPHSHQEEKES